MSYRIFLLLFPVKNLVFQGKVEMELEILTEDEAKEKPAGLGRKDPNMNPELPKPKWVFKHPKSYHRVG